MNRVDKDYFALGEIEDRWQLPHRDVVYLAENGQLILSIRLFGVHLEWGHYEESPDGERVHLPRERKCFSGLQDLRVQDVFRLFRDRQVNVDRFAAPEPAYCHILEPTDAITVREADVIVRRDERDRVERKQKLICNGAPKAPVFHQLNDYREVTFDGLVFRLGPIQSRVVKQLHSALLAGAPWCFGKVLLANAGSQSTRLADVFKSQRDWRLLIESDGRGLYRLRLQPG